MDATLKSHYERRVRQLAGFGHRGSATEQEARAAAYLADELRGLGLEPETESFAGNRSFGARLLLHIAVAAIGAALLWYWPTLTILLASAALASLILELTTRGAFFSRAMPNHRSCNIVARLAPRRGEARGRLVICGHHDSQRTGLIWNESIWERLTPMLLKLPAAARSPLLPVTLAMLAQSLIGAAALAGADRAFVSVAGITILVIYGFAGALLAEWSIGVHVPGASDNASGAAAVLALGEEWLREPADEIEVVLLLTGCEETGALGAAAWADRHRAEIRGLPTAFLNLDGLGFGPPRFVGQEAPLAGPPVNYPPRMLSICAAIAAEEGLVNAGPHPVPGFTDGLAFLVRGVPGVTVIGSRADGHLPHWHQPTDDAENMDFDAAWRGIEFARRLMPRLIAS